MNCSEYIYLLQNSENIDVSKAQQLEEVITEFPYFQSARTILLKGLNKTYSYKYNPTLKKTAAYTINRKVLFDFITSSNFIDKKISNVKLPKETKIIETETIKVLHKKITDSFTNQNSEIKTTVISKENSKKEALKGTEILELGRPIQFKNTEPHSFNEWMQVITQKPIVRDEKKIDKFSVIDKFIETNPKIKPLDKNSINRDISNESSSENDSLMTETLAKVYLEQKKYENAIKAYHILCLKYPEKSGSFADRIKAIKILQNNRS